MAGQALWGARSLNAAGTIGRRDVRPLLDPRSLVLVGASPRTPAPVLGVQRGGRPAWGVNPSRQEVLGLPCVPSVAQLPEPAECAVIVVGHNRIEAAVEDVLAAGIRHVVVPGLGSEAGGDGPTIVGRVVERLRAHGAAMIGPNCMGIAVPDGPSPWLAPISDTFLPGHVAVVAQSGSIGEALTAVGPRIGFRAVVSCGGEADVDIAELAAYFARDERTRVIALFIEAVRRPAQFAAALELCAAEGKPVVCLKVGASEVAARAARAHTGALVGSQRAFSALLARTGAIEVVDLSDLVETLEVLGRRRWPRGPRVGAVSESGGEAALLADRGTECGLRFDPLPADVADTLRREFPALVSPQNPVDAWAADEPERIFPRTLAQLAQMGGLDILVAQVDLSRFRSDDDQRWNRMIVEALGRTAAEHGLFAAVTTVHTTDPPDWAPPLARELDIALLRGTRDAAAALARAARWRARTPEPPAWGPPVDVGELLDAAGPLPEHESCLVLERYGLSFAPRRRARTVEEVEEAVTAVGCPVVIKRDGPAHKARGGGVRLGLDSSAQAAEAAQEIGLPVLVARQAAPGEELFCGAVRDPDFGPIIAVGRGGVDVESGRATAVAGPLGAAAAAALIAQAGLTDPHGTLTRAVEAVSRLMHEHLRVVEVDVNPIVVSEAGSIAVDGLVVLRDLESP